MQENTNIPIKFESSQELEYIKLAINKAYAEIGANCDLASEDVYKARKCTAVCQLVQKNLQENTEVKSQLIFFSGDWTILHHHFLLVSYDDTNWVVDPTWQQFLNNSEQGIAGNPKALIAPVNQIESTLRRLGIPDERLNVWMGPLSKM